MGHTHNVAMHLSGKVSPEPSLEWIILYYSFVWVLAVKTLDFIAYKGKIKTKKTNFDALDVNMNNLVFIK